MQYSVVALLAAVAVGVNAQGVPTGLKPTGASPAGCMASGTGTYEVTIVKPSTSKRSLEKRMTCDSKALLVSLSNGVLTDSKGRIGGIVANRQFQFDGPPSQTGTIYNDGFSFCGNSSLALGSSTDFYQCLSGGFYNLYDQPVGANCSLVNLQVSSCTMGDSTGSSASSMPGSMMPSGTATMASSSAPVVSQTTDGQPQAPSAPVSTGAGASFVASGAVAALGALAALFL